MLIDLENIVGVKGYYIDDSTYEVWSFKKKKPVKMKLNVDNRGYIQFNVWNEGKMKHIMYHQLIVRLFVDANYDPSTQQIDHLDHNKLNNSIDNLKVVSKSGNNMNRSVYNGKQVIYIDDIGENIPVNKEHNVYYSKSLDKFYRFVEHVGKYRQMNEGKTKGICFWIHYKFDKKNYHVNATKFRQNL